MGLGLGPSPCHPLTGCQDSENTICVNPHPEACSKHPDFLTGDIGGGGHVQPLQSDGPPEPGPPRLGGPASYTPQVGPKAHAAAEATEAWHSGACPGSSGHREDPGGRPRSPHPSPPACRPASWVPAATAEASPTVSGQPTPGVVSHDGLGHAGVLYQSLRWPSGLPRAALGGPARLEGRRLRDSSPRGRGCQADHSPQGPPSHGAGSKSPHQTLLPTGDWSGQQKRPCRTLHPGSTGGASTGQIHATERARDDLRNVHCKTPQSD